MRQCRVIEFKGRVIEFKGRVVEFKGSENFKIEKVTT